MWDIQKKRRECDHACFSSSPSVERCSTRWYGLRITPVLLCSPYTGSHVDMKNTDVIFNITLTLAPSILLFPGAWYCAPRLVVTAYWHTQQDNDVVNPITVKFHLGPFCYDRSKTFPRLHLRILIFNAEKSTGFTILHKLVLIQCVHLQESLKLGLLNDTFQFRQEEPAVYSDLLQLRVAPLFLVHIMEQYCATAALSPLELVLAV